MGCTQQRAVGNLHTDVLCFLNRTLECQNVGMASPSLCILILGKSYLGSKTFAFPVALAQTMRSLCRAAFSQHRLLAAQGSSLGGRQ